MRNDEDDLVWRPAPETWAAIFIFYTVLLALGFWIYPS
jgi:hypothetical protein